MRRIRFLKFYSIWAPGNETDTIAFPVAEQLVRRKIAEWRDGEPEAAVVEPAENAMRKPVRKRRARKRAARKRKVKTA